MQPLILLRFLNGYMRPLTSDDKKIKKILGQLGRSRCCPLDRDKRGRSRCCPLGERALPDTRNRDAEDDVSVRATSVTDSRYAENDNR